MSNSPNEVNLFKNFHGIVKLIQWVLHCVLLVFHISTGSSKMGLTESLSATLMSLNIVLIGCNSLVIFFIIVVSKEIAIFLLEIVIFFIDLCCTVLWADVYSNIDSNSFRKIHLVVYSIVWVLQTTLLAIPTLKNLKCNNPNVVSNQDQNITCAHFNYQQSCGRFGYKYDSRSEDRTHELTSIEENASLYFFASNSVDIIDLDNSQRSEKNEMDLYNTRNLNKSILESDFESAKKEEFSKIENKELNDKCTEVFNKEILHTLQSSRNIETLALVSNYEPIKSNQPVGRLIPKARGKSLSESKLSTGLKMYKVEFAESLEKSRLELNSSDLMTEKQEDSEIQNLKNPVKKEYIRTKTISKSQSCVAKLDPNGFIPHNQIKKSDVITFSVDSFGINKSVENEGNGSSKNLGSKGSWNASQNSNISTIMIQGHRFQKETINRLKESLKPLSRFRVIEKIKQIL